VTILPGFNEMRALYRVLDRIDLMAEEHATQIHLLGVLFCNTDPRWRTAKEAAEALSADQLDLFGTVIPRHQPVADHPRYGVPTFLLKPDDVVSESYRRVARETLTRLSLPTPVRA
jgi:chromosome partitioning protein